MFLLDVWEKNAPVTINILPINCLQRFSFVKSAAFGLKLGSDISVKIEEFKKTWVNCKRPIGHKKYGEKLML